MIELDLLPPAKHLRQQLDSEHATRTRKRFARARLLRGVGEVIAWVTGFIAIGSFAAWILGCSDAPYETIDVEMGELEAQADARAADYYEHSHGLVYDPCGIFGAKPVGERCAAVCGDLCPDGVVVARDMAESEDSI